MSPARGSYPDKNNRKEKKMKFKIVHRETLVGWFYVEAADEDEAMRKFENSSYNGDVDFSDMELVESSNEVVEEK